MKSCHHDTIRHSTPFHWHDKSIWKKSAHNTSWCLLGCAIGDFATILWFQLYSPTTPTLVVMSLAIINGILTSILLETIILSRQMHRHKAIKTAMGMSLISMIAMEMAMNITDYLVVGEAKLIWWAIPLMLIAGFLTPWPYNYWRLKKLGKACH